ncbi:MAG: hypothetical protein V9G19_02905 [Tetrasphaera sp.]
MSHPVDAPATRMVVRVFGLIAALAGTEHGIGEILQGPIAPFGVVVPSWPGSPFFRIEGGEPALVLIPDLRTAGLVTIVVSALLTIRAWRAANSAPRWRAELLALSVALLLAGGGFGPPLLGCAIAAMAGRTHRSPRMDRHPVLRSRLAAFFPATLYAAVAAWLLVLPGLPLIDQVVGVSGVLVGPTVALAALALLLAVASARATDAVSSGQEATLNAGLVPGVRAGWAK